jgi:hypothetical protein
VESDAAPDCLYFSIPLKNKFVFHAFGYKKQNNHLTGFSNLFDFLIFGFLNLNE